MSSQSAKIDSQGSERRVIARVASNLDGFYLDRSGNKPLRVLDVSATGAKLRFDETQQIPDVFQFYVPEFCLRYEVEVMWRKDAEVSVRFERAWREER